MLYSDKSEYLKTPRGQYGRYMWRKLRGRSHYSFDEEPKSKKSMKRPQKIEFQRKLLKKLKAHKKRAYRSSIIAELSFETTAQNPPFIHSVVKNYQDLFEKPLDKSIPWKGLVYQDDKNIFGISARYHPGAGEPGIKASFVPFRDFLKDLDLVGEIISGEYSDYIKCYDFEDLMAEIQGRRRDDYDDDSLESQRDFIYDRETFVQALGEEAYNAMLLSHRISAQEHLLRGLDLSVRDLHLFYMPLIMEQKYGRQIPSSKQGLDEIPYVTSKWIANSPIRIQLPNVPLKKGDTEVFKQEVRSSLDAFHRGHPIFKPLHIPVNLNVLYKPPKAFGNFFNDLDNMMRMIVPAFNEIFEPPSTHVSHVNLDGIKDPELYKSLKRMQERIPRSVRTSICGYDIYKMPRSSGDDAQGYLTASFSSGTSSISSPVFIIDSIIDKWIECCED